MILHHGGVELPPPGFVFGGVRQETDAAGLTTTTLTFVEAPVTATELEPESTGPLFPGVQRGVQPERTWAFCPRCGMRLGAPPPGESGLGRYHLPGACPLGG